MCARSCELHELVNKRKMWIIENLQLSNPMCVSRRYCELVNAHKCLEGALAPSMSRLCQSLSDQELLWCWYIYKIANWKKNHFFLILTFLTSSSNANACKNLGWTLHKDFELCTKATWVDNGTVRANLSPHTQCFGSLGCLNFVKRKGIQVHQLNLACAII